MLASDAEREWVCAHLQEACVQGRLTTEELSARLDVALSARTRAELEALFQDLPPAPGVSQLPPAQRRVHVGLMGSNKRSGRWRVPAESWWTSVMGGCHLDLTRAVFDAPVTTINIMAGMGTVEIRVPRGFEVEVIGTAIVGGRQVRLEGPPPPPGAPVIRLRIVSCLGRVKVTDRESFRGRMRQY
jgi:hypothetical protein